jgi:hypothetical protein
MKRKVSLRTGPALSIMQVVRRYQVEGEPAYDLIDTGGRFYEAAEALTLGTGAELALDYPIDSDVLVLTQSYGPPYILGGFSSIPRADSTEPDSAGEYQSTLALGDAQISKGATRLIITEAGAYIGPVLRAQGRLEVSNGAEPTQSAAVAEPTRDTLQDHTDRLDELKSAVDKLLQIAELTAATALTTAATEATAAAAAATQAGDLITAAQKTHEAARATSLAAEAPELTTTHQIRTPSPPPDIILSELLKLER